MKWAFLDEAGDVNPFSGSRFLVVAVLVVDSPRSIAQIIKSARKRLRRRAKREELKASASEARVIEQVLRALAGTECSIVAVVLEKLGAAKSVGDPEQLYRLAVSRAVRQVVARWPSIALLMDKRYTKAALRDQLEVSIRQGLIGTSQEVVLIRQEDSRTHKELQAVDFVAWALFQKYERGEERFYRLLTDRIVSEEVIALTELALED